MVTEYNGECVVMVVMGTTRLLNANGECWMRSEEEEKKRKRGKRNKEMLFDVFFRSFCFGATVT